MAFPGLTKIRLGTELELVQGLTNVSSGPFRASLDRLFDAGATGVYYTLSPTGDAFGIEVAGSSIKFASSVAAELGGLTSPALGKRLLDAIEVVGPSEVHFELTLGRPTRLIGGLSVNAADQVRHILLADGVHENEVERVLADSENVRALNLVANPDKTSNWVVWARLAEASIALGTRAEVGTHGVFTGLVTGRPDLTYLRRDGLSDLQLIDWLFARGCRGDYAARLGRVHSQLEAKAPARMRFEADDIPETLTLHYPSKLTW